LSEKGSCGGEYVCGGEYPGEMSYIFKVYGHWTLDSRASAWFCLDAPLAQEAAVVHLVCWSFCFSANLAVLRFGKTVVFPFPVARCTIDKPVQVLHVIK